MHLITTRVVLNVEALRELYVTADDTSDVNQKSFTFMIHERSITVTEHDINRILQFPTDNFAPDPTDEEISQFFQLIRLQQVDLLGPNIGEGGLNMISHNNSFSF